MYKWQCVQKNLFLLLDETITVLDKKITIEVQQQELETQDYLIIIFLKISKETCNFLLLLQDLKKYVDIVVILENLGKKNRTYKV